MGINLIKLKDSNIKIYEILYNCEIQIGIRNSISSSKKVMETFLNETIVFFIEIIVDKKKFKIFFSTRVTKNKYVAHLLHYALKG